MPFSADGKMEACFSDEISPRLHTHSKSVTEFEPGLTGALRTAKAHGIAKPCSLPCAHHCFVLCPRPLTITKVFMSTNITHLPYEIFQQKKRTCTVPSSLEGKAHLSVSIVVPPMFFYLLALYIRKRGAVGSTGLRWTPPVLPGGKPSWSAAADQ